MTDMLAVQPLLATEPYIEGERHAELLVATLRETNGNSSARCRGDSDTTDDGLSDVPGHPATHSSSLSSAEYQQLRPVPVEAPRATLSVSLLPAAAPTIAAADNSGAAMDQPIATLAVLPQTEGMAVASAMGTASEAHVEDGAATPQRMTAGSADSSNRDSAWADSSILLRVLRGQSTDLEGVQTAQSRRLMCRLKRQLFISACFFCAHSAVLVMCIVKSMTALTEAKGESCSGFMHTWLIILLGMQLSGPLSVPLAALGRWCMSPSVYRAVLQVTWPTMIILLLFWCALSMYIPKSADCPAFRRLRFQAFMLQLMSNILLLLSVIYVMSARPTMVRLKAVIAHRGFSLEEAIAKVPAVDSPSREDCVICLGCVEEDEFPTQEGEAAGGDPLVKARPPWRRLDCGHVFHEQCLFKWLKKTKRCPICRSQVKKVKKRAQDPAPLAISAQVNSREDPDGPTTTTQLAPALEPPVAAEHVVLQIPPVEAPSV